MDLIGFISFAIPAGILGLVLGGPVRRVIMLGSDLESRLAVLGLVALAYAGLCALLLLAVSWSMGVGPGVDDQHWGALAGLVLGSAQGARQDIQRGG